MSKDYTDDMIYATGISGDKMYIYLSISLSLYIYIYIYLEREISDEAVAIFHL